MLITFFSTLHSPLPFKGLFYLYVFRESTAKKTMAVVKRREKERGFFPCSSFYHLSVSPLTEYVDCWTKKEKHPSTFPPFPLSTFLLPSREPPSKNSPLCTITITSSTFSEEEKKYPEVSHVCNTLERLQEK